MRFRSPFSREPLLAALIAVGLTGALDAAGLRGVVEAPDGQPVAGALVSIEQMSLRTTTDAAGRFEFRETPPGNYVVRASSSVFDAVQGQVVIQDDSYAEMQLRFGRLSALATNVEVVGRSEDVLAEIPGSVFSISAEELTASQPLDAGEVMQRVPGLNVRQDSGPVAMRLNVGVRGLNPDRSRSVLMLEDGLPISLAPYGEPEMYYSPQIDRMERVEVLKGSGQIAYGPQTVGGVINFVTPQPPAKRFQGELDLEGGQRDLFHGRAMVGGSSSDNSSGWLLHYLHKQGDGFRGFYYDLDDLQAKFILKPADAHTLSFKAGVYDERSNSTYLGLTTPMFEREPNQNPVPGDELAVRRQSGSVNHTYAVTPNAIWNTSAFAYQTVRNWGRQDFDRSAGNRNYLAVVGDLSIPGGALFLRDSAGNRNREFSVAGMQTGVSAYHNLFGLRNKLDAGVRYIYEEAQDQRINGQGFRARTGVLRDDEDRFGKALSAYVQNKFHFGDRVVLTPGVRLESYNQERHIVRAPVGGVPTEVDIREDNPITTAVPGVGLSYRATDSVTLFTGIHRGFAPPRTKIAITSTGENLQLDPELSWNYEGGVRYQGPRGIRGEFTYFRLDFSNQIITAAESGGATTTLTNGGETLHEGFESSLRVNWNEVADLSGWSLYTDIRHTALTTAKFTRNDLFEGNRLPYAPKQGFGFLIGARQDGGFGFQFDMNHIGRQFADNNETVAATADGTIGRIPSYEVFNLLADYTIEGERLTVRPYFTVKNLFDQLYIASRAPEGIQPGLFRQANAGIRILF